MGRIRKPFFVRDGKNVAAAATCLIIGIRGQEVLGLNCQGCGYPSCADMDAACKNSVREGSPFAGPNCVVKMADLGISVGSAVQTASLFNLDNRVMYTAGVAARSLGWMDDCSVLAQLTALESDGEYDGYEEGAATLRSRLDYVKERLLLFYVAITRAKKDLIVTWNSGRQGGATPSLALSELMGWWEGK